METYDDFVAGHYDREKSFGLEIDPNKYNFLRIDSELEKKVSAYISDLLEDECEDEAYIDEFYVRRQRLEDQAIEPEPDDEDGEWGRELILKLYMEVLVIIDDEDVWKEYEMEVSLGLDDEDVSWERDVENGDPARMIDIVSCYEL